MTRMWKLWEVMRRIHHRQRKASEMVGVLPVLDLDHFVLLLQDVQ